MTSKKNTLKKIGLLCSGGDSPGMNCAIRSVVRTAIGHGIEVVGIKRGYQGLLEKQFIPMDASSVGNIIQRGGTILQTSRCKDFLRPEVRQKAFKILNENSIEALIVIGGNGSYNGAYSLHSETGMPVIGLPGTIDNDITGTDYSIGFDTAVQTAVEAVDKIRDTAHSHARTFIVEVMGRKSSAIATHVGICTGAENIILPSEELNDDKIAQDIKKGIERGKSSSIIICAEGEKPGLSYRLQDKLESNHEISAHVCILGHIQRGGSPTAIDRFIASTMGNKAIKCLLDGEVSKAICYEQGTVSTKDLSQCLKKKDEYMPEKIEMVKELSI
jgi:6-phosphofructokinase 1